MILVFFAAGLYAEFIGYWLHVLLHSNKIEFLSRNHMLHHLVVYPPDKPMRPSGKYLSSTYSRANVLGIGMEWILPAALILAATLVALRLLGASAGRQALFVGTTLLWSTTNFWYMHDAMHLKGFWMAEHPLFARWFLRARRFHDIHHMDLDDGGKMPYNFGISFFLFDRIFGTLRPEHAHFNKAGLEASLKRYAYIFEPGT